MPYVTCPELSKRKLLKPNAGRSSLEVKYREAMRKALVLYYSSIVEEVPITESRLRGFWAAQWVIPDIQVDVFARVSEIESHMYKGALLLHKLYERPSKMRPVIVDEPWELELGDGLVLWGTYDMVFEYGDQGQFWIVDWSKDKVHYYPESDLAHAALITAFKQQTNRPASVIVDYILTTGAVEYSTRTKTLLTQQLGEIHRIARSISREDYYRRIGLNCKTCPYKIKCLREYTNEQGTYGSGPLRSSKSGWGRWRTEV